MQKKTDEIMYSYISICLGCAWELSHSPSVVDDTAGVVLEVFRCFLISHYVNWSLMLPT